MATMPFAYTCNDKHYKRVPRGYDTALLRAELLGYNSLVCSAPSFLPDVVTSAELTAASFEHFRQMAPLQRWLVKVARRVS
jgi:hypothetical protein